MKSKHKTKFGKKPENIYNKIRTLLNNPKTIKFKTLTKKSL
jgi:hypothetical protein